MDYYIKTNRENYYIKLNIRYNLGGWNWGTGEQMKRAYDLSVSPIERYNCYCGYTEVYKGFSGYRLQSNAITRQSPKARANAIQYFVDSIDKIDSIINLIIQEQNFEIAEDYDLESIIRGL